MAITTTKERNGVEDALNEMFRARGSSRRVRCNAQNGGTALHLTDVEGLRRGTAIRTLAFGTRGEVVRYMRAMQEALWALDEE